MSVDEHPRNGEGPLADAPAGGTAPPEVGKTPEQKAGADAATKRSPGSTAKPATKSAGKAAAKKPAAEPAPAEPGRRGQVARRKLVWFGVFGFIFACLAATVRFFFPRAIFEPKTRYRIGYPADYGFGVSTKWQAARRIWVVRDSGGLYVIFAKCTHLGCTPDWKETDNKFKCPCHGSGFDTEGVNFEGPAPRPLERLHVEIDALGQIVVDQSKTYGGPTLTAARQAWKKEGAFVQV